MHRYLHRTNRRWWYDDLNKSGRHAILAGFRRSKGCPTGRHDPDSFGSSSQVCSRPTRRRYLLDEGIAVRMLRSP